MGKKIEYIPWSGTRMTSGLFPTSSRAIYFAAMTTTDSRVKQTVKRDINADVITSLEFERGLDLSLCLHGTLADEFIDERVIRTQ